MCATTDGSVSSTIPTHSPTTRGSGFSTTGGAAGVTRSTAEIRSADARAEAIHPGAADSVPNGSPRNPASPITVINCPALIRPSSANHPAVIAMPQASSVLTVVEAIWNRPSTRAASSVASSASRLTSR